MKQNTFMFSLAAFLIMLGIVLFNLSNALADDRFCGMPVPRDADGTIHRSTAVLNDFQRQHPCPATGKATGACPGWAKDHVIPLACGGCDAVENLQWLKNTIKSCPGTECKDRWERTVYCGESK